MLVCQSSANLETYTYLNAEAIRETANMPLRRKCRLLAGILDIKGGDLWLAKGFVWPMEQLGLWLRVGFVLEGDATLK